jgi:ATP-binding cassette subfamily C protein
MNVAKEIRLPFSLISKVNQKRYLLLTIVQITLPILDLLGIFLLGFLLQNLLSADSNKPNKSSYKFEIDFIQYFHLDRQEYLLILGLFAAVVFIVKGFFSIFVNRITYRALAKYSLDFSSEVSKDFFNANLDTIQTLPSGRVAAALNDSINNKIVSTLGAFAALVGELSLITSICIFLFFYNGILTLVTIMYFLTVFVFLQKFMTKATSSHAIVKTNSDQSIRSLVHESILSYRELFVLDAMDDMLRKYKEERRKSATSQSSLFWLLNLPKYVFESVLIFGVLVLMGLNLLIPGSGVFQSTIATFLVAGVRVLPSILRIQALLNTITYAASSSIYLEEVMNLKDKKHSYPRIPGNSSSNLQSVDSNFTPVIEVKDLIFSYFEDKGFKLSISDLRIGSGERVALVGESGSGKSTFADLLLGVLEPNSGRVTMSNLFPAETVKVFRGKIGYVPQSSNLFSTDIFGNVAPYQLKTKANIERVWECLEMAQISAYVKKLPEGIETEIGERGYKLSGGQKQRLSLARALFPDPGLLVLDEATSALDAEIEDDIRKAVESLDSKTTVIAIAHRLSTVKTFDRFLYFENGRIIGDGSFSDLRRDVEKFDRQVNLSLFGEIGN